MTESTSPTPTNLVTVVLLSCHHWHRASEDDIKRIERGIAEHQCPYCDRSSGRVSVTKVPWFKLNEAGG